MTQQGEKRSRTSSEESSGNPSPDKVVILPAEETETTNKRLNSKAKTIDQHVTEGSAHPNMDIEIDNNNQDEPTSEEEEPMDSNNQENQQAPRKTIESKMEYDVDRKRNRTTSDDDMENETSKELEKRGKMILRDETEVTMEEVINKNTTQQKEEMIYENKTIQSDKETPQTAEVSKKIQRNDENNGNPTCQNEKEVRKSQKTQENNEERNLTPASENEETASSAGKEGKVHENSTTKSETEIQRKATTYEEAEQSSTRRNENESNNETNENEMNKRKEADDMLPILKALNPANQSSGQSNTKNASTQSTVEENKKLSNEHLNAQQLRRLIEEQVLENSNHAKYPVTATFRSPPVHYSEDDTGTEGDSDEATEPNFRSPTEVTTPVPKRGRGRPRKNPISPQSKVIVKRKPGRPRKHPIIEHSTPPVKRKPGRPRKHPITEHSTPPAKRGPGRPRKNPVTQLPVPTAKRGPGRPRKENPEHQPSNADDTDPSFGIPQYHRKNLTLPETEKATRSNTKRNESTTETHSSTEELDNNTRNDHHQENLETHNESAPQPKEIGNQTEPEKENPPPTRTTSIEYDEPLQHNQNSPETQEIPTPQDTHTENSVTITPENLLSKSDNIAHFLAADCTMNTMVSKVLLEKGKINQE